MVHEAQSMSRKYISITLIVPLTVLFGWLIIINVVLFKRCQNVKKGITSGGYRGQGVMHPKLMKNCTTITELQHTIQLNTCHQMASVAFRFYQIQFRHDAAPNPLVGWGGNSSIPFPTPSTPSASRCRRLLTDTGGAPLNPIFRSTPA